MAQYYTDFSDIDFGTDFTHTGSWSLNSTDNDAAPAGLAITGASTAGWCRWLAVPDVANETDCEVRALVARYSTTSSSGAGAAMGVGGLVTARRGIGTVLRGIASRVRATGAVLNSGSINTNAYVPPDPQINLDVGVAYWVSIARVSGSYTCRVHSYPDKALIQEWAISPPESNQYGVGFFGGSVDNEMLCLAVGTAGDPAPYGPPADARRRAPLFMTPW